MLLYETLDTLLWVYGWKAYPTHPLHRPRRSFPTDLSENFKKVIRLVDDWPGLIENIPFPSSNIENATIVHDASCTGEYNIALDRFCKVFAFEAQSKWGRVCAHIHKVGFVLHWLPYVSIFLKKNRCNWLHLICPLTAP
jgi:hypothetical protein